MSTGWLGNFWANAWLFREHPASGRDWNLGANTVGPSLPGAAADQTGAWFLGNQVIQPPAGALAIAAPYTRVTDVGGATAFLANGGTTAYGFTHICPVGTTCLAIVTIANSTVTGTAVSYNGQALTHVDGSDATNGGISLGVWYLMNPPTGAQYALSVTYSGSTASGCVQAVNLIAVNPNAPVAPKVSQGGSLSGGIATLSPTSGPFDLFVGGIIVPTQTTPPPALGGNGVDYVNGRVAAGENQSPQLGGAGALFNPTEALAGQASVSWIGSGSATYLAALVAFQYYYLLTPGGTADSPTTNLGISGQTPTVTVAVNTVITPAAGALALAGAAPTVVLGVAPLVPSVGALTFAGQAPTLATNEFITAGALSFAGQAPTVISGTVIAPAVGSLAFTGQAPALAYVIAPPVGALTFAGQAPSLVRGTVIAPPVGALSFAGVAITLGGTTAPPAGALSFAGQAPTLVLTSGATPSAAALTFAGVAPLVAVSKSPAAASLVFTGAVPTQDLGIAPGTGSLNFDGDVAPLDDEFAPAPGALTFSGSPPTATIQAGALIVPDAGALAFDADDRDYTAHLALLSGLKPQPPVPSIPTYPFVQYLQALEGPQQVMHQEAPYLLPEEVD